MDAGAVGALIGISVMICLTISMKIYDSCQRNKKKEPIVDLRPMLVRRQSKMNMILPK